MISVFPFINIIIENESINSNKYYYQFWKIVGSPPIQDFILFLSLIIISIIIFSALFNFYTQYLCNIFASDIQISLGQSIYRDILYAKYEWHLRKNPIKLMTLFTSNLTKLSRNIIRQIPLLIGYVSTLVIPIISLIILFSKIFFNNTFIIYLYIILFFKAH